MDRFLLLVCVIGPTLFAVGSFGGLPSWIGAVFQVSGGLLMAGGWLVFAMLCFGVASILGSAASSAVRKFIERGLGDSSPPEHRTCDLGLGVGVAIFLFVLWTDDGHRFIFRWAHKAVNAVSYITKHETAE